MGKNNETGFRGERIAEEYLLDQNYLILHRNWRTAHKEVDLIAIDNNMLVFIEIKTRNGTTFGFPEESVSEAKQNHLRHAAEAFLEVSPQYTTARFDVISIVLRNEAVLELRHLKDAF